MNRGFAERVQTLLAWGIASLVLGCPVEPRDFAKPPEDEGGTGGACVHDCQGGQCSNGQCQPLVIGRAVSNPTAIAISDSNVFWTENDGLKSCPKTGCASAPNVLSTDSGANGALVADGSSQNLFFASCCPSFLDVYSGAGSRVSRAQVPASIAAMGIDADYVYWNEATTIVRATRAGASPTTIATGLPGRVRSFAFDASSRALYAACTGNQGGILRVPTEPRAGDASSNSWTVVTKMPNASSVAIANGNLYFAVQGTDPTFNDGGVYQCPLNGCTQPTPLRTGRRATAVVTSATDAYFIVDNSLYSCPLTGCSGSPTLLAAASVSTPDGPVLAQDATTLYWISTEGTVVKLAK